MRLRDSAERRPGHPARPAPGARTGRARGLRTPIDFFFRHLAADQKEKAIGVILSGMGSDGTLGMQAIKEQLGMVMVQDPASAKYDGMPRSAINTAQVDYVASAEELPAKLLQYVHHVPPPLADRGLPEAEPSTALQKVFVLLRRPRRERLLLLQEEHDQPADRASHGRPPVQQPGAVRPLPPGEPAGSRVALQGAADRSDQLLPRPGDVRLPQGEGRPPVAPDAGRRDTPLRVWNPGCSTGEETYSLAIVLKECLEGLKLQDSPIIQIFATDIDQRSHRQGPPWRPFRAGIATDVSPERLQRFFVHEDAGYRDQERDPRPGGLRAAEHAGRSAVHEDRHPLLPQPLDLRECRDAKEALAADALRPEPRRPAGPRLGGEHQRIRATCSRHLDEKWKVFQRLDVPGGPASKCPRPCRPGSSDARRSPRPRKTKEPDMDILYAAQRALLDLYGPPAVVVNAEGDIVYVSARHRKVPGARFGKSQPQRLCHGPRGAAGRAGRRHPQRRDAARPPFHQPGRQGQVQRRLHDHQPHRPAAGRAGCPARLAAGGVRGDGRGARPAERREGAAAGDPPCRRANWKRNSAAPASACRARSRKCRPPRRNSASTNEELQSNNEELQSTNEELNSSKEELQSLNEEMQTVNAELQTKMEELSQSNSDMKNLLNGIEIATIFLDNDLGVKRFTPEATQIVNLAAGDVGRPLSHFTTNLKYDRLVEDAKEVLDRLVPKEAQVEAERRPLVQHAHSALPHGGQRHRRRGDDLRRHHGPEAIGGLAPTQKAEVQAARDYAENIIATDPRTAGGAGRPVADRLGQPLLLRDLPGRRRPRPRAGCSTRSANGNGTSPPCGNSWTTSLPRTRNSGISGWSTISRASDARFCCSTPGEWPAKTEQPAADLAGHGRHHAAGNAAGKVKR